MKTKVNILFFMLKNIFIVKLFVFFFSTILNFNLFSQVIMTPRLINKLNNIQPDDYVRVLCLLKDRIDISALDRYLYEINALPQERAYIVITTLMNKAEASQVGIKQFLYSKLNTIDVRHFKTFWITNLVLVEGTPNLISELMQRDDLELMDLDTELRLEPYEIYEFAPLSDIGSQPNLKVINADKLWALGITGKGRIVMNNDTGVDGLHPALQSKWRGNFVPWNQAWFDPETNTQFPNDSSGHGTRTIGIICGHVGSDTIGVAPDAQWIAAKTINNQPITDLVIQAFEWAMNPDGNPSTINDMPDVINNSWYDPDILNECNYKYYKDIFNALEAAGIAVVFAAGNRGPQASSITSPKNININEVNVFTVGSIEMSIGFPIYRNSSRGPSKCGGTGSLLIKPEVVAPGVYIRTSDLGGSYCYGTGTSFASPHVAGAIALLKQAFPNKTGKEIKEALYYTAIDLGEEGEDNTYGRGIIDVYAAFLYLADGNENSYIVYTENRFENENAGGTIIVNNIVYPSGSWIALTEDTHVFRTNNERFVNYNDRGFTIKHNNWAERRNKFYLLDTIEIVTTGPYIANFYRLHYAKINNKLENIDSLNLGTISFQDPWYVLSDGSQPGNHWINATGYYEPTGSALSQEKGVFLDQSGPSYNWDPPYYSVGVVSVQNIELPHTGRVHQFYFQGWSASPEGSAEFQNADELETPVVFKQPGATVSANYKGSILKGGLHI